VNIPLNLLATRMLQKHSRYPGPKDWSVGVMEYWKNENPTPIFCNSKQRPSRSSDALSSRSIDHHSSTPILLETVTGRADYL
jgi:hypothetical protein